MAKAATTIEKTKTTDVVILGGIVALTGLGIFMMIKPKPGVKQVGDTIKAKIRIVARGYPNTFLVGFGLAHSALIGRTVQQFVYDPKGVPLALENDYKTFEVTVSGKLTTVFETGKVDALVFVQSIDGKITADPNDYLKATWMKEVYEVA